MTGKPEIGPLPLVETPGTTVFGAAADVRRLTQAMWSSAIIQAAAQLGLADLIGDDPVGTAELAGKCGADPGALRRLMRALAAHGIFHRTADGRYEHTAFSRSLVTTVPGSVSNIAMLAGSGWNWTMWARLADAVRSGESLFPAHYGRTLYEYFAEVEPGEGEVFNRAMSESSRWTSGPVADALDLTGVSVVADVAGGQGSLLRTLLERNPDLSGVLLDSPEVLRQADPALREGPLAARCRLVPTDIRQAVPAEADVYLLRQVTHIWENDVCVSVLRNCAHSARPGARVVLVDHLIEEGPEPNSTFSTLLDLLMMLVGTGGERTESEFAELFARAGLRYDGVVRIPSPLTLVTASVPS
ncbi:methyltransferase [Streptomyces lincolnensis]|uniref:acetylserotonin O-methyltransferase n=1 Tax=Streptomyces lincolnensis TaxID=1915 RepID=UPI001E44C9D1|nr:acetylserotonin O-methyltransferase [Streptomyces lincolnensis]MCD7445164.1 methyltransferase [Streptomyces lincolnensis]